MIAKIESWGFYAPAESLFGKGFLGRAVWYSQSDIVTYVQISDIVTAAISERGRIWLFRPTESSFDGNVSDG